MGRYSREKVEVALIDSTILAVGQLLQPVCPGAIFSFGEKSVIRDALDEKEFKIHFKRLEREGLFWRTADDRYVVTARGDTLARASIKAKDRDKIRLLILNKNRYTR